MSQPPGPLPDILAPGLEVLFVGYNPGLRSAATGHNFAGRGNQFWRLLADSGLTPRLLRPEEDRLVPGWRIGITNLVARPTASAADLARSELRAGVPRLRALVRDLRPRFIAYAGKGVYLAAAGLGRAAWGAQPGEGAMAPALDFVLPSPSGLARLRYGEKLRWYRALAEAVGR